MPTAQSRLDFAIESLYHEGTVTGLRDVEETHAPA